MKEITIDNFEVTEVFEKLVNYSEQNPRGIILEGGSRSSKTYSIIQFIILYCINNDNKRITIARAKFTWLQASVIQDFIEILINYGIYDDKFHTKDKSNYSYNLFNNRIYFVGLDDKQRLHGLKHDIFWINEAIEADKDSFDQLNMRLTDMYILDYNPSRVNHFIYELPKNDNVKWFKSTMLDNPFLSEQQRNTILSYKPTEYNKKNGTVDEVKWKIYGLGERAQYSGNVYNNWKPIDKLPETYIWRAFGDDLGFNDPSVLVEVRFDGKALYFDEVIYESGLTSDKFLSKIIKSKRISKNERLISEIDISFIINARKKGLQCYKAIKKANSIYEGIQLIKKYPVFLTKRSTNAWNEYAAYVWRENKGYTGSSNSVRYLDEAEDKDNHFMDAARYVVYWFNRVLHKV